MITTVVAATKLAGFRELAIFIAELGTGATVVYFIIKESEIRSLRRKGETPAAAWAVTSAQIKFFALLRSLSFALRLSALGGSSYRFLAVAAVHGMVLHGFCANIGNQGWKPKKRLSSSYHYCAAELLNYLQGKINRHSDWRHTHWE